MKNTTSDDIQTKISAWLLAEGILCGVDILTPNGFARQQALFLTIVALIVHGGDKVRACLEQADYVMPEPLAQGLIDMFMSMMEQD